MPILDNLNFMTIRKLLCCNMCHTNAWPFLPLPVIWDACILYVHLAGRMQNSILCFKKCVKTLLVLPLITHIGFSYTTWNSWKTLFQSKCKEYQIYPMLKFFLTMWTENPFLFWHLGVIVKLVKAFNFIFQNE